MVVDDFRFRVPTAFLLVPFIQQQVTCLGNQQIRNMMDAS